MIEKHCVWCDSRFLATQRSQIYCSADCREKSSREKITQRYLMVKRKKRMTKERKCAGGCGTSLSIYNDSNLCNQCLVNVRKFNGFLKELKGMADEENK